MIRIEVLRESSTYVKLGMLLLFLGGLFHVVGLSAPYWVVISGGPGSDAHIGLWVACLPGFGCVSNNTSLGWLNGCKFLELFSLFMLVAIVMFLVIYRSRNKHIFILIAFISTIVTALCIILGVIIFAAESIFGGKLNWAFGLEIVAAIILIPASVLFFLEFRTGRSSYQST